MDLENQLGVPPGSLYPVLGHVSTSTLKKEGEMVVMVVKA